MENRSRLTVQLGHKEATSIKGGEPSYKNWTNKGEWLLETSQITHPHEQISCLAIADLVIEISENFNASKLVVVWEVNPGTWLQWVLVESKELCIYLLAQLQVTDLVLNFVDFDMSVQEVGHIYIELCVEEDWVFDDVSFAWNECCWVPPLLVY